MSPYFISAHSLFPDQFAPADKKRAWKIEYDAATKEWVLFWLEFDQRMWTRAKPFKHQQEAASAVGAGQTSIAKWDAFFHVKDDFLLDNWNVGVPASYPQ